MCIDHGLDIGAGMAYQMLSAASGLRHHLTCSACGARHQKTEGEALREAFALALRLESGEGVFRRRWLMSARRASAR